MCVCVSVCVCTSVCGIHIVVVFHFMWLKYAIVVVFGESGVCVHMNIATCMCLELCMSVSSEGV